MSEKPVSEMSEVELYFIIDGIGGFIWKMNHDMADGRIEQEHHAAIDADIEKMRETQLEAIRELPRIGIAQPLDENGRGTDEYWKWYRTWSKWHKNTLSPLEWDELNILMARQMTEDLAKWCKCQAFGPVYHCGTVYITNRRLWEHDEHFKEYLTLLRCIGIEMETAAFFIAAFSNHIPHGALLLVSDMPLIQAKDEQIDSLTVDAQYHVGMGIQSLMAVKNSGKSVRYWGHT